MQRVLVVGGAGLVGSHLVDRLLAEGSEVVAIDDFSRGSYASLAHLKHHPRVALLEHDVRTTYRAVVTQIFHLAVPSSRLGCEPDPVKALVTCVVGTLHALATSSENGARLVMGTSTERWGEGVRCAEALACEFAKNAGLDVRFVRMPSAYGPRMELDSDHFVTTQILEALRGKRASQPWRPDRRVRLAFVDDVVDTLVAAMGTPEPPAEALVAPSHETTLGEVARMIAEAPGRMGTLQRDHRPGDAVGLPEGIRRTVEWFETRLGARPAGGRTSGIYTRAKEEPRPTALSTALR